MRKRTLSHIFTLLALVFIFSVNVSAKKAVPLEGELRKTGVRSSITIQPVVVSFDENYLYLEFNHEIQTVEVLIFDENLDVAIHEVYLNPQSELIYLDSFTAGNYKIELRTDGGLLYGYFSVQ